MADAQIPRRTQLQTLLEGVLGSDQVHFQPPPNVQMEYPAIVYSRDNADTEFADNRPYRYTQRYEVTHISRDVDEPALALLAALPLCSYSRFFTADNLYHDVYTLYF